MNWQKEMEARLADDPRLERKKSRFSPEMAFYLEGREIAHFHPNAEIDLRLTAAGIYAHRGLITDERVRKVSKDWVVLRLESEEDLEFAQKLVEYTLKQKPSSGRPKGKTTRRTAGTAKKSHATKAFASARALKALEELKVPKGRKGLPRK